MRQSEYEKLCDDAFGKPEKRNALKKHKKLILYSAAALVLALAVLMTLLRKEPDSYVHREIEKPTWLQIEFRRDNGFLGIDISGDLWWVECDMSVLNDYDIWCWITVKSDSATPYPVIEPELKHSVVADKCWNGMRDERMHVGYGYDICEFDIDRDGVVEQCILGGGGTSGVSSYELSVWNGSICEERVFFVADEHYYSVAFCTKGEELKIIGIGKDQKAKEYYEELLDISFTQGKTVVSVNREPAETLPDP